MKASSKSTKKEKTMKLTDEQLKEKVATIRNGGPTGTGDIIPVLENAINYGDPYRALYIAAIEEIKELRRAINLLGNLHISKEATAHAE
jgi:hypothetical protein